MVSYKALNTFIEQFKKQDPPKLVTEDGILMDVREEQKENGAICKLKD